MLGILEFSSPSINDPVRDDMNYNACKCRVTTNVHASCANQPSVSSAGVNEALSSTELALDTENGPK